jgi:hypothetical protein
MSLLAAAAARADKVSRNSGGPGAVLTRAGAEARSQTPWQLMTLGKMRQQAVTDAGEEHREQNRAVSPGPAGRQKAFLPRSPDIDQEKKGEK